MRPARIMSMFIAVLLVMIFGGVSTLAASMDIFFNVYTRTSDNVDTLYGTAPVQFDTVIYGMSPEELNSAKVTVEIFDKNNNRIDRKFYLDQFSEVRESYSGKPPYNIANYKIADLDYSGGYTANLSVNLNGNILTRTQTFKVNPPLTSPQNIDLKVQKNGKSAFRFEWTEIEGATGYNLYLGTDDGIYYGNDSYLGTPHTSVIIDFAQEDMAARLKRSSYAYAYVVASSYKGYFKILGRSTVKYLELDGAFEDEEFYQRIDYPVFGENDNNVPPDDEDETLNSTNAKLGDILINGDSLIGFSPDNKTYTIILPKGTNLVPVVTANTLEDDDSIYISNSESLPGLTTITVKSQDGLETTQYVLNFMVAKGHSGLLNSITLSDGILSPPFSSYNNLYSVILSGEIEKIPEITAVPVNSSDTVEIVNAKDLPGSSIIKVKSPDSSYNNTYTVSFKLLDNDSSPVPVEMIITVTASLIAVTAALLSIVFYIKLRRSRRKSEHKKNEDCPDNQVEEQLPGKKENQEQNDDSFK